MYFTFLSDLFESNEQSTLFLTYEKNNISCRIFPTRDIWWMQLSF